MKFDGDMSEEELLIYLGECNYMLKDLFETFMSLDFGPELNHMFKTVKELLEYRLKVEELLMKFSDEKKRENLITNKN